MWGKGGDAHYAIGGWEYNPIATKGQREIYSAESATSIFKQHQAEREALLAEALKEERLRDEAAQQAAQTGPRLRELGRVMVPAQPPRPAVGPPGGLGAARAARTEEDRRRGMERLRRVRQEMEQQRSQKAAAVKRPRPAETLQPAAAAAAPPAKRAPLTVDNMLLDLGARHRDETVRNLHVLAKAAALRRAALLRLPKLRALFAEVGEPERAAELAGAAALHDGLLRLARALLEPPDAAAADWVSACRLPAYLCSVAAQYGPGGLAPGAPAAALGLLPCAARAAEAAAQGGALQLLRDCGAAGALRRLRDGAGAPAELGGCVAALQELCGADPLGG
eukprot:TRINITY_DN14051_c0_g1_i1.p1 TRINITY_DN14051_c0_g1~~TRINITY_DN14051_c0_g1_i1.p1  ORF type:complete len:361 (+),score=108.11 TRINITY_DN14051_c0_g1_i1:74-1084(+)